MTPLSPLHASLLASGLILSPLATLAQTLPDAAAVARYANELLERQRIDPQGPGVAVLVARGDEVLVQTARGMASIELGVALTPEQRFRLGSVTKQFAAALLLRLIDQGKARLDDPLSKFLPDYPNGGAIRLSMLLNHSGGMKSYTGIRGYMHNPIRRDLSTQELVAEFKNEPVDFAPGAAWAYNNSGYVLVGAVIEAITGKPWWDGLSALKAPVFYPAGDHLIPGHVSGYTRAGEGRIAPAGLLSMTQPHAAGALVGDLQALWRWNQQLHEGGFLQADSYRRMTTPEGPAAAHKYGFGIGVDTLRGQTLLSHGGGIHGFSSVLQYLPQQRVTVALLRNADGGMNLDGIGRQLAAFAAGKPFPEPQAVALKPEQMKGFEGVYSLGKDSRTLRLEDGVLTSQRSGSMVLRLTPVGPARFAFSGSPAQLQLERDAGGAISGMRFIAEGDGEGEFWPRSADLPQRAEMVLSDAQRQELVGVYVGEGLQIKVFVDEQGLLRAQVPGQPVVSLKASGARELYLVEVDARLSFAAGAGPAGGVVLLQGPARIELKRSR